MRAALVLVAACTTQPVQGVEMYVQGGPVHLFTCQQAFLGVFDIDPERMVEVDGVSNVLVLDHTSGAYAGSWRPWSGEGPFYVEITFDPSTEGAPVTWWGSMRGADCTDTMLGRAYRWR